MLDLDSVRVGVRAILLNKWLSEGDDGSCAMDLDAGTARGLMRFLLGAEDIWRFEYHDFNAISFIDRALLRFNAGAAAAVVNALFVLDIFVYMSK